MTYTTTHKIYTYDSRNLQEIIPKSSIDLVVTSPPYPMIQMWDDLFFSMNSDIKKNIFKQPQNAFELMHNELDKVWTELYQSIKEGGFLIVNIGDATRTIQGDFQLFSNHSRVIRKCVELGFKNLPNILWRKQTNAPNKFMGSGMLPAGAYVTLEHEYILVFRKGERQVYGEKKRDLRRESAYFWEERNIWFSDIWEDIKGTKQVLKNQELRERSAAYPFDLVFRLISMYSCKKDTVLDPFLEPEQQLVAAISSERNSIGIEMETSFKNFFVQNITSAIKEINDYIHKRIEKHKEFIKNRLESGKEIKHYNNKIQSPVVTKQEVDLLFRKIESIKIQEENLKVEYLEDIN